MLGASRAPKISPKQRLSDAVATTRVFRVRGAASHAFEIGPEPASCMTRAISLPAVLDASALLAFLRKEPGAERVQSVLSSACISAVNLSETIVIVTTSANLLSRPLSMIRHGPGLSVPSGMGPCRPGNPTSPQT
jgi:hypothetical protein